jgi:hypothetical protein
VTDPKYAAFTALDPFFDIVQQGLACLVDGDHYFDTLADDAEFEFRYHFPGWPETVRGRDALMALYAGYGNNIVLHSADELVVQPSAGPSRCHHRIRCPWQNCRERLLIRQPVHFGRYHRGPKDRAMAGLYGLAGSHDCA